MAFIFSGGAANVSSSQITDGTITNADINSAAAIARTKLGDSLLLKVTKSAQQDVTASPAVLTFDTEVADTDSAFASNVYTSPRDQQVLAIVVVGLESNSSTDEVLTVSLRIGGSAVRTVETRAMDTTGHHNNISFCELLDLSTDDTVDIVISSSGTATDVLAGGAFTCFTIVGF